MDTAHIDHFFATLQAANPLPASELEYTSGMFELLVRCCRHKPPTWASTRPRKLFPVANTPQKILDLGLEGLEGYIRTIGLFRSKARHLMATCRILVERHGGDVPRTREELEALPGVGRKTANVVLNVAYGEPTMAVDTHIFRVSNRTGSGKTGKTPIAVEQQLLQTCARPIPDARAPLADPARRYVCLARTPRC